MAPKRSLSVFVGLMMLYCVPSGSAQQATAQQIVNQYWPSRVERDEQGNPDAHTCLAVMTKSASCKPSRIAAGYAGSDTVLRVLEREKSGQFRVAFEAVVAGAIFCEIEVLDIDKDGADDILLTLGSSPDGATWVFRAQGTTFEDITPLASSPAGGDGFSELINAAPVDLDHRGALEFVATVRRSTPEGGMQFWSEIYRYQRGRLLLDTEAVLVRTARPTTDSKLLFLETMSFDLINDKPGTKYVLRIINGDRRGRKRAAGVTISINGERLAAAARLTAPVEFLDIPIRVPLKPVENETNVVVAGAADAEITIVIQAAR
jgi:VCBS repeat protein